MIPLTQAHILHRLMDSPCQFRLKWCNNHWFTLYICTVYIYTICTVYCRSVTNCADFYFSKSVDMELCHLVCAVTIILIFIENSILHWKMPFCTTNDVPMMYPHQLWTLHAYTSHTQRVKVFNRTINDKKLVFANKS